jgi:hypothetical protein
LKDVILVHLDPLSSRLVFQRLGSIPIFSFRVLFLVTHGSSASKSFCLIALFLLDLNLFRSSASTSLSSGGAGHGGDAGAGAGFGP